MSQRAEPEAEPSAGVFPSTRWSRILGARDHAPQRERDLELLARAYLVPIRRWFAHAPRPPGSEPDALAQDFFVWMLESGFLERADPARGRFRGYLKTALRHFAVDQERRRRAQKRGGGQAPVPLDHDAARELAAPGPAPDA